MPLSPCPLRRTFGAAHWVVMAASVLALALIVRELIVLVLLALIEPALAML